jgi:maleylpyruvate isomerase
MRPDQTLNWMHGGTERLLAEVAGLPDAAMSAPTALPGWTRAYLLSHIAANADALRNLVHWARTGEERRMYASAEAREADIAAGAELPADLLRARVASSAADLAADLDALDALDGADGGSAWDAKIITAQGLTRTASEIPWMRTREIYIHAIDMAAGTTFADLPPDFLAARPRAAARPWSSRPPTPAAAGTWPASAPRSRSPPRSLT